MLKPFKFLLSFCLLMLIGACSTDNQRPTLPYESYTLENGLKVVLHQDLSDPIVAVAIQYHVGSGREKPGKTGFAHFFEHMLFQRSENLPRNAFFQKIAAMGGTFNGSTNSDGTNYFETVPRDALEKVLWMESDRMGFFINTVTQGGLEREIDVVSNEKRQNYDTQAYGQSSVIISQEFYPKGHPYSWTTIGEIDDLRGATIDDVKEFYHTFYVPSNATLVISGDFEIAKTKELVEKYFGEIKKGNPVSKPKPQPVTLNNIKKVMWEDDIARMPQLSMVYSTVEQYHPDSYALSYFASLFSGNKKSPLYRVIVDQKKLAPSARAYSSSREVAGQAQISVTANPNVNLNDVYAAIFEAFELFEKEGINEEELANLKTQQEVMLYNRMGSVQGKALMMARDNEFAGDPVASINQIDKYLNVTKEDIMRVYNKYIKGQNHLLLSIFPKGQQKLAIEGSTMAKVSIEKVDEIESKSQAGVIIDDPYEKSPSKFDRSVEPDYLPNKPELKVPQIWNYDATNGMKVYGITHNELPIIQAQISLKGGALLDPSDKGGLANIAMAMMNEGTANRTPEELESAISALGARISFGSGGEGASIYVSSLAKNFDKVMELVEEMILYPRFDENSFARLKMSIRSQIARSVTNPNFMASSTRNKLIYGVNGTLARPQTGTIESLAAITIDDVKQFCKQYISPACASVNIVGDIDLAKCKTMFASLESKWSGEKYIVPEPIQGVPAQTKKIYFVDQPGATQSMIMIAKKGPGIKDSDLYPSIIANNRLGSGSQGLLFEVLRLQRGYTYGAYSSFSAGEYANLFTASSSVQGSKTKESVELFKQILTDYPKNFDQATLDNTKNSMLRAMAGSFETVGSLVGMLSLISEYDLPFDYVKQREKTLNDITVDELKSIMKRTMNSDELVYVVVGDAKTQLKPLEKVGLGKPILVQR